MAEIEIGVMRRQCLDRRIHNRELLETEIRAWEHRRTESGAQIRWMFSTDQARTKKWPNPIQRLRSKSHNHCDGTLVPVRSSPQRAGAGSPRLDCW